MKAIVYHKYGSSDVLKLRDIPKPVPKDNEVLVKVHSASVNPLDWHIMRGKPFLVRLMGFGFLKPKNKVLGADIAGSVEEVGKNVKKFQVTDEVFLGCGSGGFAEYISISEDKLVPKPANTTFEEIAALPVAGLTALQALRDYGHIQSGQKVLINGASGGVGTFAVQIAKSFGTEVTGVCSTRNMDMVRSIGADYVIDYTKEDFIKNGQVYDLILDTVAYRSITDYKNALSPDGIFVMVGGSMALMFKLTLLSSIISKTGSKKIGGMMTKINTRDLTLLKELFEVGKVKSVIDRRYPLSKVPEAIRYLEGGHAQGKVVITV